VIDRPHARYLAAVNTSVDSDGLTMIHTTPITAATWINPSPPIVDQHSRSSIGRLTSSPGRRRSSRPLGDNVVTRFSHIAVVTETEVRSGNSLRATAARHAAATNSTAFRGGVVHVGVRVRRSGEGGYDDKLPSIVSVEVRAQNER
jgi:hypothetical protein